MTEIVQLYRQFIELKTNPAPNDKEQVEILERIIGYLRNTDKDSMVAFMWARQTAITRRYQSEASLLRAKGIFLDMLDNLAGMLWDLNYTVKNVVYEVIFRLLKRAELSDLTLLGFDPASTAPPTKENVEFASNLRKVLLRILRDVLERVGSLGASRGADQREGHVAAPERLLFAHHLHLHVPHPLLRRRGLLAALGHAHAARRLACHAAAAPNPAGARRGGQHVLAVQLLHRLHGENDRRVRGSEQRGGPRVARDDR